MELFKTVTIRTPESVELKFFLAGVGSRAVALAVDYGILAAGLLGLLLLWLFLLVQLATLPVLGESLQLWLTAGFSLLIFGIYIGYFVGFETCWYGQTPGKRYARIRVIRDNGQPEGLFQATLRSLLRPVDDIFFVGFFCILLSKPEKRLGDWLAGTLVIQIEPSSLHQNFVSSEQVQQIAQDLLNSMNMDAITAADFATLREYLQRRPHLTRKAREDVSLNLARRLRKQAQLESLPTAITAEVFLEAIYHAYQQHRTAS